jgi:4-hydroxy-4-methyl-2-oxoglutarate aldolase
VNDPSSLLAQLATLDACAVSDALDALRLPGAALGITRLCTDERIFGTVMTVRLVAAGRDAPPPGRHLGTAAVEASDQRNVIVIDHAGRADVAGWGGNLSVAARQRGVRGVIIDGSCRDIDESREIGFPVFGRGTVPRTARGRVVEHSWNVPVSIAGVEVEPGDLVIADGSGVVFIPRQRAEEVLATASGIVGKERQMADRIRAGVPVSEAMGAAYETMTEAKR